MKEPIKILLVDDNDDDRFLTVRALKRLQMAVEVSTAKNGDEAKQFLLGGDPISPGLVLLLDLQMPKVSGTELLSDLRSRYGMQQLHIIILSSSDNPGDIALCNKLGVSGYLSKPPATEDLERVLREIAGG